MTKHIIFIILLLTILSFTTHAVSMLNNEELQCVTQKVLQECINVSEVENFTNESIFNFLKDFENQLPKGEHLGYKEEVLICKLPDEDIKKLMRRDYNYYLDYFPLDESIKITCPPIINVDRTLLKVIISLISINKNSKGGVIIVISLISIVVWLGLKFIFKIKITILIKKSWTYISKKVLNILMSKQNKKKSLPRNR